MESSTASSRAEAFPAGLRVLVVDDDPTWLKILEKMLRKCSYEVTTCGLAREALDMLRERRDRFDTVISDVNMPDMDGFKLLEHVGLEMDLPVIMMSVDGETSKVMKGVQHGACDYLLKPVRMKELKNIWQHVLRKKIHEIKEIESHDGIQDFQFVRNRFKELDERHIFYGGDFNSNKKRKDTNNKEHANQDFIDPFSMKKARVVWSVDLHQQFVNAVNQIGFDKVGPKKILDLMNVRGLTRENVASHLQKYRLYLSRLQNQNEWMGFGGVTQSEFIPKDSAVSSSESPQNSSNKTHSYSGKGIHAKGLIPEHDGDDFKGVAVQAEDSRKVSTNYIAESQKQTYLQLDAESPKVELKPHEPINTICYSWEGMAPETQFMEYPRQQEKPLNLFSDNKHVQHVGVSVADGHFPIEPPAFNATQAKSGSAQTRHPSTDNGRYHISNMPPMASTVDSVSVRVELEEMNSKPLGTPLGIHGPPLTKSHYPDQFLIDSVECTNLTEESAISFSQKDHILCSLQGYSCFENVGLNSMEFLQFNNPTALAEFPGNCCEGLQFEHVFNLMECPAIDGGLFI